MPPSRAARHGSRTPNTWRADPAGAQLIVGLTIGLERPHQARRLLELIEAEEAERAGLVEDAAAFLEEALA